MQEELDMFSMSKFQQIKQNISSWTGFNITIRRENIVLRDTVGYLPTIHFPASTMNTIYEVLMNTRHTKDELKLKHVVIIFDQVIYYFKAVEITWKHRDLLFDIVPRLGVFHTISCLLSVIGKLFLPADLRDVIIESGVIEEGSLDRVLNGKAYNWIFKFHKLMY